jgi:hypothetical protein
MAFWLRLAAKGAKLSSSSQTGQAAIDTPSEIFSRLGLSGQFLDSYSEKPLFGFLPGKLQRLLKCRQSVGQLARPSEQLTSRRVGELIRAEFAPAEDAVDHLQSRLRAVPHGYRDRPIEFDDRRGIDSL